jgi:hypothetical protein
LGVYRNGVEQNQPYRNGVMVNAFRNGVEMFESGPPPPPFEGFGMVVNSGGDSQFILPLRYGSGTAHHELTIDWGDGDVQTTTGTAGLTAQYQGLAHSYPAANKDYTILITGTTYLESPEVLSYSGFGFSDVMQGCTAANNTIKVKKLVGSLESIVSPSMSNRNYCFRNMFNNCKGLTELSATLLPATTLATNCYYGMFMDCTGLTAIPATLLPATTLSTACYRNMFYGCTGLTFIYMTPDWFTGKTAQYGMFTGCTKITANTAYADIPAGWK